MRKLIVLGVLVAALGVADVAARAYAEGKLDARAKQEAPPGSTVDTSVRGFPFLGRLLVQGAVSEVDFHLTNVNGGEIVFAAVDVDLHGVHLDRDQLFKGKARLTGLDRGTVTVDLTQEALSAAMRVQVRISNGQVAIVMLGREVRVTPVVTPDGALAFRGNGIASALTLRIPKTDTVPCIGGVTVLAGRLRLACTIKEIPPAFLDAAQELG